jgi:hypothetical protein
MIKLNRNPVAQDYKNLAWSPENFQRVAKCVLKFLIFHLQSRLLGPNNFYWATNIVILGAQLATTAKMPSFITGYIDIRYRKHNI